MPGLKQKLIAKAKAEPMAAIGLTVLVIACPHALGSPRTPPMKLAPEHASEAAGTI